MPVEKIEHIGIAVKNLEESIQLYERLLGCKCYKIEEVYSEHVTTAFFQVGEVKIELLQARNDESAIHKFIEKRGEGIHHIAFAVPNIADAMDTADADGFQLLGKEPKNGADNKAVCFIHPKSTNGVLVEFCQERTEK